MSGDTFTRLDEQSRLVLARAAQVADASGETLVEPRHVLIALLIAGDTAVVGALGRSGVSLDSIVERIIGNQRWKFAHRATFRRTLTSLPPTTPDAAPSADGMSPHARKVLSYAGIEADALGHDAVRPAHLLLGLIHSAPGDPLGGLTPYVPSVLLNATRSVLNAPGTEVHARETLAKSLDQILRSATDNFRQVSELGRGALDDLRRGAGSDSASRFGEAAARLRRAVEGFGDTAATAGPEPTIPSGVHPSVTIWDGAHVRDGATIGEGTSIGRGAYVGPGVVMGRNCKLQNLALVYEPAMLGDGVFIGPGAVLTNDLFPRAVNPDQTRKTADDWHAVGVTIRDGASIGARAVCVAPVTIGEWAMVGAGAVVVHDVPAHALVVGSPARQIGWVGRAGHRLVEESNGRWRCDATGETYLLVDGIMAPARPAP
jgi:acetyltransferase-like isoleucine patch superfamily enzyme